MPNRILRDWTDSERVNALNVHAERFFTRLIMKADDYGRFVANPKLLKSFLYPLLNDIRETDISSWLAECKASGLIAVYEVNSKAYLQINDFRQTLRIKRPKYPPPPECMADDEQTHSTRTADAHLNRIESEAEVETESEKKASDAKNFKNANNASHLRRYFDDGDGLTHQATRDALLKMYPDIQGDDDLRARAERFNLHLAAQGTNYPLLDTWQKHFKNWLPKAPKETAIQKPAYDRRGPSATSMGLTYDDYETKR